jgi:hypothetical protein
VDKYENSHDDTPRFEPWLAVLASSIVPEFVALYLPPEFFVPAILTTVVLFLTGLLMLRRQTLRRRLADTRAPSRDRRHAGSVDGTRFEPEGLAS